MASPTISFLDVCQNENFQPNCPGSESIFIETAKYGRIRSGKCFEIDEKLEDDPKWMGCAVDVTDILRQKCSVRHYCDVPVKDKELSVMSHPCHKGLLMSLNVRYRCMPGTKFILGTYVVIIILTIIINRYTYEK